MTINRTIYCSVRRDGFTPLEKQTCLVREPRRFSNSISFLTGFTLAEAMMATVVLGIAAAGVLLPFVSGAAVQAEGTYRTLGANLAGDLVERAINTPFAQIVATYNGYTEPQAQIRDAGGALFTDPKYARFSRSASCEYVYMPQQSGATEPVFIRVTVRAYYGGKPVATITRLVSR